MLKEEERRQREEAVYRAVLRLIGSGADITRLRVQEIAAEAGIGKGTVYEYFTSKEEILHGVTQYCMESELARVRTLLDRCATLDDVEKAVTGYLADLYETRAEVYRVVARTLVASGREVPCACSGALRGRVEGEARKLVARLQAAGEIDPALDEEYAAFVLISVWVMYLLALGASEAEGRQDGSVLRNGRRMLVRALRPAGKPEKPGPHRPETPL